MVKGSKLRNAELAEKMAFFEAFGALVGAKGIPALEKMLAAKGLLTRKEDPETRACAAMARSEGHTSELQSRLHLVCRLLLEKKKKQKNQQTTAKNTQQNEMRNRRE